MTEKVEQLKQELSKLQKVLVKYKTEFTIDTQDNSKDLAKINTMETLIFEAMNKVTKWEQKNAPQPQEEEFDNLESIEKCLFELEQKYLST